MFKIRAGEIHEIESMGFLLAYGSTPLGDKKKPTLPGQSGRVGDPAELKTKNPHETNSRKLRNRRADRFDLGVKIQYFVTHFAAPSGLLIAAEGHRRIKHVVAIDPDGPRPKQRSSTVRLADVASPDAGGQTILGGVGLGDEVVHILEWDGGDHGPEDFFPHDLHLFVGVDQDRGLDEVALLSLAAASDRGLGTFRVSGFQIAAHAIHLLFRDQRAHIGRGFQTWANADLRSELRDAVNDLIEFLRFDVEPRTA